MYEEYYINGNLHRENGPARIKYYGNGNILEENYFIKGELHRIDGPAQIKYHSDGTITKKCYYINGKSTTFLKSIVQQYRI